MDKRNLNEKQKTKDMLLLTNINAELLVHRYNRNGVIQWKN